jgi:hypothetical protein
MRITKFWAYLLVGLMEMFGFFGLGFFVSGIFLRGWSVDLIVGLILAVFLATSYSIITIKKD